MGTVDQLNAKFWDQIEALQSVSIELALFQEPKQLAEHALELALDLTKSSVGFISLVDEAGEPKRVYSRSTHTSQTMPSDEIERMVIAASASASQPVANTLQPSSNRHSGLQWSSFCVQTLRAGDRTLGMIGVAKESGYTAVQHRALSMFAHQLAAAIETANLKQDRQVMVDAMVNLRNELDRSEQQRLASEEHARTAARLESP